MKKWHHHTTALLFAHARADLAMLWNSPEFQRTEKGRASQCEHNASSRKKGDANLSRFSLLAVAKILYIHLLVTFVFFAQKYSNFSVSLIPLALSTLALLLVDRIYLLAIVCWPINNPKIQSKIHRPNVLNRMKSNVVAHASNANTQVKENGWHFKHIHRPVVRWLAVRHAFVFVFRMPRWQPDSLFVLSVCDVYAVRCRSGKMISSSKKDDSLYAGDFIFPLFRFTFQLLH